ncbi:TPA: hypothetical protein UL921_003484, partial [Stenotrophomonas maltophilia]|nr:hypothetical protein [Stenotrophomonas maltophilia]
MPRSWFGLSPLGSMPAVYSTSPPATAIVSEPWVIQFSATPLASVVCVPLTHTWSAGVRLSTPATPLPSRTGALQPGASPSPPAMLPAALPLWVARRVSCSSVSVVSTG